MVLVEFEVLLDYFRQTQNFLLAEGQANDLYSYRHALGIF